MKRKQQASKLSLHQINHQKETKAKRLYGILECPINKGFIEFEYDAQDLVSDLREKLVEVWGFEGTHWGRLSGYGIWDARGWAILCEDEEGAFMPLKDTDSIPTCPPPRAGSVYEVSDDPQYVRRGFLRRLFTRRMVAAIDQSFLEGANYEKVHLTLRLHRGYKVPNREYSIRLVALVRLVGG